MKKAFHLADDPLAADERIFESRLGVMGITRRKSTASAFIRGREHKLSFEYEPSNNVDPNAIKIKATWKGWLLSHSGFIGYVPKEVAARVANLETKCGIRPRLLKTYRGSDGFMEVEFQLVGPKDIYQKYIDEPDQSEQRHKRKADPRGQSETEADLLADIEREERRAADGGYGVAAQPYRHLAQHFRRAKRKADEVAILERFAAQHRAPGKKQDELMKRLEKLQATSQNTQSSH